jgi:transposase InsO family protein
MSRSRRRSDPEVGGSGRWSARRKMEAVLRLLQGEDLDALSRQLRVTAATLSEWRGVFLASGMAGLKSRGGRPRREAAKRATRYEALEPVRQGVRRCFGRIAENVAAGLTVRHDHGSQYLSAAFQAELAFLGLESSPAFVRAPEGNGCAERVIRTL